jgi:hypothetical protein
MKKFLLGLMLLLAASSGSEVLPGYCGPCVDGTCATGVCADGACMC